MTDAREAELRLTARVAGIEGFRRDMTELIEEIDNLRGIIAKPPPVLNLWRVVIKTFSSERNSKDLVWYIASKASFERQVFQEAQKRFSGIWWSDKSIIEVTQVGKLVMLDGVPLVE